MFFTDLSKVTDAIKELVRANLVARFALDDSTDFTVTAASPEATVSGVKPTISVYLFHVIEDAVRKNAPPKVGGGSVPVRFAPMGLTLYYVITVLSQAADEDDTNIRTQQKLLGFVAKTVHDFPVISDQTLIDGSNVLEPFLGDNRVELILRPVKIEETITFWSTQDARTPKLSLFIEARVVLLEPETPETISGIVLSVGNFVFPGGVPQITTTRSRVAVFLPGSNPTTEEPRKITAVPARVAMFDGVPTDPPFSFKLRDNNLLTIEGAGFSGEQRLLTLRARGKSFRVDMDDATHNTAWAFALSSTSVNLRFQDTVFDTEGVTHDLTPGVYATRVTIFKIKGGPVPPSSTNEVAFTVTPQIINLTGTGAARTLEITGDYLDPDLVEIQLGVGGVGLKPFPGTDPLENDTYRVTSGSTIDFKVANPPTAGHFSVVQLSVNAASAPPAWIVGP